MRIIFTLILLTGCATTHNTCEMTVETRCKEQQVENYQLVRFCAVDITEYNGSRIVVHSHFQSEEALELTHANDGMLRTSSRTIKFNCESNGR